MLFSSIEKNGIHYTRGTGIDYFRLRQTSKFVCATNSPLSVVQNKYFRNIIKSYNNKIDLISSNAFRDDIQNFATTIKDKHIKSMNKLLITGNQINLI